MKDFYFQKANHIGLFVKTRINRSKSHACNFKIDHHHDRHHTQSPRRNIDYF